MNTLIRLGRVSRLTKTGESPYLAGANPDGIFVSGVQCGTDPAFIGQLPNSDCVNQ